MICKRCGEDKDETNEFRLKKRDNGTYLRHHTCKLCERIYQRARWHMYAEKRRLRRQANKMIGIVPILSPSENRPRHGTPDTEDWHIPKGRLPDWVRFEDITKEEARKWRTAA